MPKLSQEQLLKPQSRRSRDPQSVERCKILLCMTLSPPFRMDSKLVKRPVEEEKQGSSNLFSVPGWRILQSALIVRLPSDRCHCSLNSCLTSFEIHICFVRYKYLRSLHPPPPPFARPSTPFQIFLPPLPNSHPPHFRQQPVRHQPS